MSESQSRYSIVERLTKSKLDIITAKSQLDGDIEVKKQAVEEAEEGLKDWEATMKAENDRERRDLKRKVEVVKRASKNAQGRKKTKATAYEEKIKAIDEALQRIEEISKTAPQN